jgi:hypothetical protein
VLNAPNRALFRAFTAARPAQPTGVSPRFDSPDWRD